MKKIIFPIVLIFFFFFMLFKPAETFYGSSQGLLLWFQIVLPTLLPFIILTNLLMSSNIMHYITKAASPILSPIFHTSLDGTFAIITGFLCGYPMGSKVTADLLRTKKITKDEASYLLSFCNNTSPMFIMNYAVLEKIGKREYLLPSFLILTISPILASFLFRKKYIQSNVRFQTNPTPLSSKINFQFSMLDHAIMDGFEAITKVGGYIIIFSVLLTFLKTLNITSPIWSLFVLPSLEITNGISLLTASSFPFPVIYVLVLSLISFGGICSIAQTQCMLNETGISVLPYIIEKLITATVTSFLTILYLYLRNIYI